MKPEEKKSKISLGIDTEAIKETILNFIVPLIAVGVSFLLLVFYAFPTFKSIPLKKQELSSRITLEKNLKSKYDNLTKLVDFKSVLEEDSNMVSKVLVSEAEVPKMLDQVNQIAVNSGMVLDRLGYSYGSMTTNSSSQPGAEPLSVVSVSLGSSFTYDQMIVFMESAENAARFLSVPNFRYSKGYSTDNKDTGNLSGSFSIESPYIYVQSNAVTDEPLDLDISDSNFVKFINDLKGLRYYEFLNNYPEAKEEKNTGSANNTNTQPSE